MSGGHDLHLERPAREVASLDGRDQVGVVRLCVGASELGGDIGRKRLDPLVRFEVVLDETMLTRGVGPRARLP